MPIQSFTPDNFRKIIDYENRRGLYLEAAFFPEAAKIAQEIKEKGCLRKPYRAVFDFLPRPGFLRGTLDFLEDLVPGKSTDDVFANILGFFFAAPARAIT
jgi:hypothetical protein